MAEVLSFSHAGVRCAVPSRQVALVSAPEAHAGALVLWPAGEGRPAREERRCLALQTAKGLCWLEISRPSLAVLDPARVFALPALLRELLPLRYVVGWTELEDEIVWLVDAQRLATGEDARAPGDMLTRDMEGGPP